MKLIEKLAATEVYSFPPRSVMLAQELNRQRQNMLHQIAQSEVAQASTGQAQQTPGGTAAPQTSAIQQASRNQGRGATAK